jgi:hypothetical protein
MVARTSGRVLRTDRPAVDLTIANTATPGGTPWLLNQFGLA